MKLSDWASIAEIVSGLAVLVTLIFLILGIRENTATTRAAMFDSSTQGLAEFRSHVINNPEVADLWDTYVDYGYDDLDRRGQTRVAQLVMLALENMQRAYFLRQYGVLGEAEWTRFEFQTCNQYLRLAASEGLGARVQSVLTNEFWDYMTTDCDSNN